MALDLDDEILQDFLVEAGEILELLGEQLVELEQRPADKELLNAVFRGFHTIKGGASFVGLTAMVEVCHVAEDVFNLLRQGQRSVDANLMDVILRVVDSVNQMFTDIKSGKEPEHADPQLIARLRAIQTGETPVPSPAPTAPPTPSPSTPQGDISDAEYAKLMDAMESERSAVPLSPGDEINENEFEQLLDKLHGKGKHGGIPNEVTAGEDITDEEFEALLDDLHGKGKHGGVPPGTETPAVAKTSDSVDEVSEAEFENLLGNLNGSSAQAVISPNEAAQIKKKVEEFNRQAVQSPEIVQKIEVDAGQHDEVAHDADKDKRAASKDNQAETTVRVDTKRLDDIMNMVGELVLVRNRLVTLESALNNEEMAQAVANLDLVTADLQTAVMKTRMQPIKKVFGRFPRVVRDLARTLRKEVKLELIGEDTDLDKNLVEALADPLVHLVRNAVDHGIEMPDVRDRAGKSRMGTVILAAEQEGDHILLTISDDGGGMDHEFLRKKAVEKGVMDEDSAARLSEKDCYNLIFAPGFSTKTEITDISGRGVGMDVVKTRIAQLNGTIDIESKKGTGTKLSIKVPLTLAIMPTLMVMLERQIFALPLVSVSEIFNLDLTQTNTIDGQPVIMLRDRPLPIYFLKDWLVHGASKEHPASGHVVVVTIANQKVGFVVEHLIGQEEVVIKPLGAMLQGTKGLAGATITGDGRIALILDVPNLVKANARR